MGLTDKFGRQINYLRLSVTDRCNLRCCYCMPRRRSRIFCSELLSFDDLARIARQAVALGMEKIRVTGGEPLVREGVIQFLERLASIDGLKELVLTTNGVMLEQTAAALRLAGVQRLNVSLDSLQPKVFARITGGGDLARVLRGIAAAESAGFPPVKINVVVMRGYNDDEVLDFASMAMEKARTVRFIEYMPLVRSKNWRAVFVSGQEILERIRERYLLVPSEDDNRAGPAKTFSMPGAAGAIGIITTTSGHFCHDCNRIRVTASGFARGCLFSKQQMDLKPYLGSGDDDYLRDMLQLLVTTKPGQRLVSLSNNVNWKGSFAMSQIGG